MNPRDIAGNSEERRRRRRQTNRQTDEQTIVVNPRDIAGELRRRRQTHKQTDEQTIVVNPRDIAGNSEEDDRLTNKQTNRQLQYTHRQMNKTETVVQDKDDLVW